MECLASLKAGSDGFFQEALLADCKRVSSGFVDDELSGSHMAGIMPVHKNGRARRLAHCAAGAGCATWAFGRMLFSGSGFSDRMRNAIATTTSAIRPTAPAIEYAKSRDGVFLIWVTARWAACLG